jgi:uncharacterized protein YlbG (UPF0298 family)
MHGTTKPSHSSLSGKFKIIYGETFEFGHGGPYAQDIFLILKGKPKVFISEKCYGDAVFAEDESCFYFLYLNMDRMIQIMQFDFEISTLKIFKDTYTMAQFESVKTKYAYNINGKNWIEAENRYNEGLIICDTNDENVERKTIIEI